MVRVFILTWKEPGACGGDLGERRSEGGLSTAFVRNEPISKHGRDMIGLCFINIQF